MQYQFNVFGARLTWIIDDFLLWDIVRPQIKTYDVNIASCRSNDIGFRRLWMLRIRSPWVLYPLVHTAFDPISYYRSSSEEARESLPSAKMVELHHVVSLTSSVKNNFLYPFKEPCYTFFRCMYFSVKLSQSHAVLEGYFAFLWHVEKDKRDACMPIKRISIFISIPVFFPLFYGTFLNIAIYTKFRERSPSHQNAFHGIQNDIQWPLMHKCNPNMERLWVHTDYMNTKGKAKTGFSGHQTLLYPVDFLNPLSCSNTQHCQ